MSLRCITRDAHPRTFGVKYYVVCMVVPRAMGPAFCEALDLMGRANATVEEVVRWSDWPATKAGKCAALVSGFTSRGDLGGAHFIAPPLRRLLGAASVHAFSPLTPRGAFASIERSCGPAMAACPEALVPVL